VCYYGQVATLACAFKQTVSFATKFEQLYAYLSTAGEDTRLFGFGADAPPTPLSSLLTLAKGTHVTHSERGAGVICKVDPSDWRGRPYVVEYANGERHHYTIAAAASKLCVDDAEPKSHSKSIEGTRVIHRELGHGVIQTFQPDSGTPYVVEYADGERHRYSLAAILTEFDAVDAVSVPPSPQVVPAPPIPAPAVKDAWLQSDAEPPVRESGEESPSDSIESNRRVFGGARAPQPAISGQPINTDQSGR